MLLILEIALFLGGLWAIIQGKVPPFLIGGGKYQVEGNIARVFGFLLLLPFPVSILGSMLIGLFFGESAVVYAVIFEFVVVIGTAVTALIVVRTIGQKRDYGTDIEGLIAKKAQGSLMYAILSATGIAAIVACPLAYIYAGQALKLIKQHNLGEEHRRKALIARGIAAAATLLWGSAVVCTAAVFLM